MVEFRDFSVNAVSIERTGDPILFRFLQDCIGLLLQSTLGRRICMLRSADLFGGEQHRKVKFAVATGVSLRSTFLFSHIFEAFRGRLHFAVVRKREGSRDQQGVQRAIDLQH